MRDPYEVLGVDRKASAGDIKSAFRRLAKKLHPDANKNDPKAASRFAELNAAYEILGDDDKRKAFDRGEIDAEGKPRFQGFRRPAAARRPGAARFGPDAEFRDLQLRSGGFHPEHPAGGRGAAAVSAVRGYPQGSFRRVGGAGAAGAGTRRSAFEAEDFGTGADVQRR